MQSTILVILPTRAVFLLSLSLPPQILPISTFNISTNGKQDSWSSPTQTRICYIFRLWVITKALLKQISLYLLSDFCIRIINIMLKCPDNKSARNHQLKSCVPAKSHWQITTLKSSLPFSLFLLVWRLESTTTKSLLRHFHCRGSPLF